MALGREFHENAHHIVSSGEGVSNPSPLTSLRGAFGSRGMSFRELEDYAVSAVHDKHQHDEMNILLGYGGNVSGVLPRNVAALAQQLTEIRERLARTVKDDTATLLAMLDMQILNLEAQAAEYHRQADLWSELYATFDADADDDAVLDTSDPKVVELLRALGIPEDEWDKLTRGQVRERMEGARQRAQEADAEVERRKALRNEINEVYDDDPKALTDLSDREMDEAIAEYKRDNPDFDPTQASVSEFVEVSVLDSVEDLIVRSDGIDKGVDWFNIAVRDLALNQAQGTEVYVQALDRLIDTLPENVREELLTDSSVDQEVKDRIRVDQYEKLEAGFASTRGTDAYYDSLAAVLSDPVKDALLRAEDAPRELRQRIADERGEDLNHGNTPPAFLEANEL